MRRIALVMTMTVAALILLFSYRTSRGAGVVAGQLGAGSTSVGIVVGGPTPTVTGSGSPKPTTGKPPAAADLTVNGTEADTDWGIVQVQVTIHNGRITDVKAIQYPHGNGRDDEINSYALPQLHDQVLAAQSANIDGVSGATVTSGGYIESLQAALDIAHFG